MALVDLISEDVVKVPLKEKNKTEVIRELVGILKTSGKITDFDTALEAILNREAKQSTGLEYGIAVPHGKTNAVQKLTIAIGVAPFGVEFESLDGKPAHLFFLLLAPPNQSGPHVEALSEIAKLSRSRAFCTSLVNARSARELVALLKEE